jgi:hypothetical protein
MNFVAKNEDYFSKQALLGFDFYQQQGRDEILNNPTIKKLGKTQNKHSQII